MFFEVFLRSPVTLLTVSILILGLLHQSSKQDPLLRDIPFVGNDGYPFAKLRAQLCSLWRGRVFLEEAFNKYGKMGQICLLPSIFGSQIVLPSSLISWILEQPGEVLSSREAQIDGIQANYSMLRPEVAKKPAHETEVWKELKNRLNKIIPGIQDEISLTLDDLLGFENSSFRLVNLDEIIRLIVARASNRAFVGKPLCREPLFTLNAIRFVDCVPLSGLLLNLVPKLLSGFAAIVLVLGNRFFFNRCARHLNRFFIDRIRMWQQNETTEQDIYADWAVAATMKKDNTAEKTPDMMSHRLMALNFAAIHTSTMTTTNFIMDIASGQQAKMHMEELRRESESLKEKRGDQWDVARIGQMVIMDSALRESMRLSGIAGKAFAGKVIAPDGLRLPDGSRLPYGTVICTAGYPMHHDESLYNDPFEYRYDRFLQKQSADQENGKPVLVPLKMATTTDVNFAAWGHGKHACPGRFFAVALIKMIVDSLLEKYELNPWEERPKNIWVGENPIPRRTILMGVRRR